MKKIFFLFTLLLFLTGCGTEMARNQGDPQNPLPPAESEVKEGDFIYRLYTEKDVYDTFGDTAIFAELTYVGDQEEINIAHAASPFYFPMEERTRGLEIGFAMSEPLIFTNLKKGEPLRHIYQFAGGYSDQDDPEYVQFVKSIIANKGFPEGEYIIHGTADFTVADGPDDDIQSLPRFVLSTDIGFRVTDPVK
ncbi:lipoprotein [Sporosarcina sp. 179-K 3D1 HS]|uniref:lipoprotein n=1 Tax=Sporosarcina sp. 179-K 3D1 HS TaxID=3232169 RepID=UPI0039A3A54E